MKALYTAELMAIYKATRIIADSEYNNFFVCSDSKSALQALGNKCVDHPSILDILMTYAMLKVNKEIMSVLKGMKKQTILPKKH